MRIHPHNRNGKKTALIALGLLAVIGLGSFGVYAYLHRNDIKRDANGVSVERTQQDLKLEEELKRDVSRKEQSTQTDRPADPVIDEETNLQQANVVLTNTGQSGDEITASGFVSNVVEEGGVCTFVFTDGQRAVKKNTGTLPNANSTTCKTVRFNKEELSAGTWRVYIEYSSSVSAGNSNELEVRVT